MIKRNAIGNFFARVLGQTEPLRDNLSINEGLGACGDQTILENGILFEGNTANIFLGRKVRVASGSRLVCTDEKSQIRVGDGTQIHWGACLETGAGGQILLGKFNSVNPYCIVYGHGGVRTGDYVRIAAQTVIIPADHVFSDPNVAITKQGLTKIGITIEDDVWIGAGCRIFGWRSYWKRLRDWGWLCCYKKLSRRLSDLWSSCKVGQVKVLELGTDGAIW